MTVFTLALAPAALLTQQRTVILSTTTSTQDSGLLEPLRLSNFPWKRTRR
jgi:ABC-type tungstate transport system permease subunit